MKAKWLLQREQRTEINMIWRQNVSRTGRLWEYVDNFFEVVSGKKKTPRLSLLKIMNYEQIRIN